MALVCGAMDSNRYTGAFQNSDSGLDQSRTAISGTKFFLSVYGVRMWSARSGANWRKCFTFHV
jgi:hypothetical protein